MSIKIKLLWMVAATLVCVGFVNGVIIYWQNMNLLGKHVESDVQDIIRYDEQLVTSYLGLVESTLTNLANDSLVIEALETGDEQLLERVAARFTVVNETVENIENIALQEIRESTCIVLSADKQALRNKGRNFSDRDYCKGIIEKGSPYLSSAYISATNKRPVLGLVVPVKNNNGDLIGFVYGSVGLMELREHLTRLQEDSVVDILDRNGTLFLSTREDVILLDEEGSAPHDRIIGEVQRRILAGEMEGYFQDDGDIVGYVKKDSVTLIFRKASHSLMQFATALNWVTVFSTVMALMFIALIIVIVFGRIAQRITRLSLVTEKISKGHFDVQVEERDLHSNDELGDLARTFSNMGKKLEDMYENLEEKVLERTEKLGQSEFILKRTLEKVKKEKNKAEVLASDLEKFKLALEGISDQVIITNADGIVLYANSALEKITGFTPQEVLGKKAGSKNLWGGHMGDDFYKNLWHCVQVEKKVFQGEFKNRRKDGRFYQAVSSISPLVGRTGDVEFFVSIERDVTNEREVDKAKTEFVSLASHQLRTPLSAINWYTEMLLAGDAGSLKTQQREYLEEIYRGNKRMIDLVRALLNVSRLEMGTFKLNPVPTDIKEASQAVIKELVPMIQKKGISFKEHYALHLPKVHMDPKFVSIVFQNLVSNALKYTPENGKVKIGVEFQKKGSVLSGMSIEKDSVYIFVQDNGYGIPRSQQDKIFSKLFRADNVRAYETEGTGLGLYLVKAVIEHSGGSVWFVSEEGVGTTFHVLLPIEGALTMKEGDEGRQEGVESI